MFSLRPFINRMALPLNGLKKKGSFAQNFAVVFSGSALITAIGFLFTPILSRIYSPHSYGVFSVFNSLVANINLISSLCYGGAFLLEKDNRNFYALVRLTVALSLFTFLITTVCVVLFKQPFLDRFNLQELGSWIYLLPVILLVFNANAIMRDWLLREKMFKKMVGMDVGSNLFSKLSAIGYGVAISQTAAGLVVADLIAKVLNFIGLLAIGIGKQLKHVFSGFSVAHTKAMAIKYKAFPLYQLPTYYVDSLGYQIPIYTLTTTFGASSVGLYSFAMTLLEIPLTLLGRALAPVFLQRASDLAIENPLALKELTLSLYKKLLYAGILPFSFLTVYGDVIFKFVFGTQWEMAGLFTAYLGYSYIFKLIDISTSGIFAILNKQKVLFTFICIGLVIRSIALAIGIYFKDLEITILSFGVATFLSYLMLNIRMLMLLDLPYLKITLRSLFLIGLGFLVFLASRLLINHLFF